MGKNHIDIVSLKSVERGVFEHALSLLKPGMLVKIWIPPHFFGNPDLVKGRVVTCSFLNEEALGFDQGIQFQKTIDTGVQGSLEKFSLVYCWHDAEIKGFLYQRYLDKLYDKRTGRKGIRLIKIASFQHLAAARRAGIIKGWREES